MNGSPWKETRVLITGISGFVGPYLAKDLINQGAKVYGLIRRRADGSIPDNIKNKSIEDELTLIEGNFEDISGVAQAIDDIEPEYIFHLGAQSFVPRSFTHPVETTLSNVLGTQNLLEAIRIKDLDTRLVFAGSSEEYGLVISSEEQYALAKARYGTVFPEPVSIPEVPIAETNPLRPMSPYAVTKVCGEYLCRNYHSTYGFETVVSRGFNHEGAGRGRMFVTSVVTRQVSKLIHQESDAITIGNVSAFRDWSHVLDIVKGYELLATNGASGDVYNQGSSRTTSVISYILHSLHCAGYSISSLATMKNDKKFSDPLAPDTTPVFGVTFPKTALDTAMLTDRIEFTLEDQGIRVNTDKGTIPVLFDADRFRPSEVPILFSDTSKISRLGFVVKHSVEDIIKSQLNYYLDPNNRMR